MNKIRLPHLLYCGLLFLLTACQAARQPLSMAMMGPGDTIDGMNLTTGATKVPPLWAFCSPVQENQNSLKTDCHVPPMVSEVAIGPVFHVMSETPTKLDWSEFTWELSMDEQPIDLARFGTYQFAIPVTSGGSSLVREVFKTFPAWDVVLTNLKPGTHTLQGLAQSKAHSFSLTVNLVIEGPYASDFGS